MPLYGDKNKSAIDRARRSLYSPKAPKAEGIRHDIHVPEEASVAENWAQEEKNAPRFEFPPPKKTYKIILRFAIGFFVLSIIVAGYSFFGGSVFVSSDNVDMTITGPSTVAGGEPTDFSVSVQNKNKTAIELVDLIVQFPVGAKNPAKPDSDAGRQDISLGTINAGQEFHGRPPTFSG